MVIIPSLMILFCTTTETTILGCFKRVYVVFYVIFSINISSRDTWIGRVAKYDGYICVKLILAGSSKSLGEHEVLPD